VRGFLLHRENSKATSDPDNLSQKALSCLLGIQHQTGQTRRTCAQQPTGNPKKESPA